MEASSLRTTSVYDSVPLPLGETMCIRVIKIRPSVTSDNSDHIACDFRVLNVYSGQLLADVAVPNDYSDSTSVNEFGIEPGSRSDRTKYQALSYTWGDTPVDHTIELDGTSFGIRKNLWDFLFLARKRGFNTYLWVDAICIDQETVGERNHQVGMMGEVYSSAECVIVWLGLCNEQTANTLYTIFDQLERYHGKRPRRSGATVSVPQVRAMKELCNRPYWSRAWIVQEYLLAKSIDIWYGPLRMRSESVQQTIKWFTNSFTNPYRSATRRELSHSPAKKVMNHRHGPNVTRRVYSDDHDTFGNFLRLLVDFNETHCADQKDRIYALLPLLSIQERRYLDVPVDYSHTATALFLHLVLQLVHSGNGRSWPLRAIDQLRNMLRPNFFDRETQRTILKLRKRLTPRSIGTFSSFYNHRCEWGNDPRPVFGVHGCPGCGQVPTMTLGTICTTEFSRNDWQSWAWALLRSPDPGDQEYGSEILQDEYFGDALKLLEYDHLKHFEDDDRKHLKNDERRLFDKDELRIIARATKNSGARFRVVTVEREKWERKRLDRIMTRPLKPASARHYRWI